MALDILTQDIITDESTGLTIGRGARRRSVSPEPRFTSPFAGARECRERNRALPRSGLA